MSHGRRGPDKRSHGYPIQIYFEAVDVGKSLAGTKKRIKWRFGWTESPEEQEVELVHSLVSGKKTVIEDGQEIHSATSVTSTTFSHAWHSHGLYVFRVEVISSIMEDAQYMFTIDGVLFQNWQRKGQVPRSRIEDKRNLGRYSDEQDAYVEERGTASSSKNKSAGTLHRSVGLLRNQNQTQNTSAGRPTQQHVHRAATVGQRSSAEPPAAVDAGTFDPFSSSAATSRAYDPFAQQDQAQPAARTARSRTDSGGAATAGRGSFENFDAPASNAGRQVSAATSAAFEEFEPSTHDLFAPTVKATTSAKARTASADLLSMDFTSPQHLAPAAPQALNASVFDSFAPGSAPPAIPVTSFVPAYAPAPVPVPVPVPVPSSSSAAAAAVTDQFGMPSKLVNLDLSGRGAMMLSSSTSSPSASTSTIGGPPLNSMMQQQPATKVATMPASDPFGAPNLMPASALPAPSAMAHHQPQRPQLSHAASAGGITLAMGAATLGSPPPNPFASMRPAGAGMSAPGSNPPALPSFLARGAAGPSTMSTRGPSVPLAPPAFATQPKSSLDSIDPFKTLNG